VGGDFYDVIVPEPGRAVLVMADVSDKGMPAALYMALTRSLIRAEAKRSGSPREVLLQTHQLLMEISQASMFFTAFCGVLDLESGHMIFARAGHDRPLHYRAATGDCVWLNARGMLLGFMEDVFLEEAEAHLQPGDALVLYTDGVTDANDPTGAFFGDARLEMAACQRPGTDAQALCDRLFAEVAEFQAGATQFDDIAIMVLQAS
jgi:sigma-B regulation protein RsbU (phosphoserine phosphatase)